VTSHPRLLAGAAWLHAGSLIRLLAVLDRGDGEEARVVGGAVRNALLGEPITEFDVATTALPEDVMRRVAAAGFKPVPTGIEHGTVTVVIDGQPFEVTTLREDVETFGRHANVRFGRDWKTDAERRDFTMNALSTAPDGTVFDYVGGLADIEARRVRFIGDAATRIAEDYLRILRFFRFHAAYGHGGPDPAGLAACIAARAGLEQLSRERVRMELFKLVLARHAVPTLATMTESGLLVPVLGGVPELASFSNMAKVEAAAGVQADPVHRLGALAVRVTEDAERLWQRLRLSNAEHERLTSIGDGWWRISPASEQAGRALLYRLGPQRFVDRVLVAWSRAWPQGAADAAWRELATLPERWTVPVFPLKAADFVARGVERGPALGAAMREAEAAWIAAGFPGDAASIEAIVTAAIAEARPM
jgi:tRNA nucleotidyltransferase/poly(A) polymerase